jgi:two-component system, OmpR family, sensor histidine kinase TctE
MFWKRKKSLKRRLFELLLPAVMLVVVAEFLQTRSDVLGAANSAYDRSLLGAVKAIDVNISTASGGLGIELPYHLFEFFQLTAAGPVYFRVATVDGLVEIGNPDLPMPAQPLKLLEPVFYDADYFSESVRVAAYMRPLDAPLSYNGAQHLVIQVAENTAARRQFSQDFALRAAVGDVLLLGALLISVALLLSLGLRPISRLADETRARQADDLSPLEMPGLPEDIQPLVDAANQQMQRTAKLMEDRRHFLDDASHQLRTTIATLRAQVDYALRQSDREQAAAALKALSMQLDYATRSTNQLLALAKSDAASPSMEQFDLRELCKDVAIACLPQARTKDIDLGLNSPDERVIARGDRMMLREALLNLVHNSITYGHEKGEVTLLANADNDGFELSVVDNGPGMERSLMERAGERFAKGKASRGAGLGLAIARSVVERHGGHLRLEAPEKGGLNARLWWPRQQEAVRDRPLQNDDRH